MKIQGIFFDLGGVLVRIDKYFKELRRRREVQVFHVSRKSLRHAFDKEEARIERGQEDPIQFWRRIAKRLKMSPLTDEVAKTLLGGSFKEHGTINQQTLAVARHLMREYPVGIISNTIDDHVAVMKMWNLFGYFDPVVLSNEIGMRKPERRIFLFASRKMGIPPGELLFIDDNPKWLRAARKAGFKTILFKSPAQLKKDLRKAGVRI